MKFSITGTRDGFSEAQLAVARDWLSIVAKRISEFHSGDCVGVDDQMLDLLLEYGYVRDVYFYPALVQEEWRAHGLRKLVSLGYKGQITQYKAMAPKTRNGFIVEAGDEVWAFPGSGGGTWDAVRKAQKLGRRGMICYPDGRTTNLSAS